MSDQSPWRSRWARYIACAAYLRDATLSDATLSGVDLSGADLICADLTFVRLIRANLFRANLSRARLYGAILHGANLTGAILIGTDLSYVYLAEATVSDADLTRASGGPSGRNVVSARSGVAVSLDLHAKTGSGVGHVSIEDVAARRDCWIRRACFGLHLT
ncbi:pentapeptide repeat-containing protein [Nocardia abscessus]|uniref:pentapeptide repeat-containing protein n=1 Tax=Nocardia abscessus TaxID=120957 RepID=UPI002454C24B|nr:pentapeptide repeat-containing protein [Nocardia abscessus]